MLYVIQKRIIIHFRINCTWGLEPSKVMMMILESFIFNNFAFSVQKGPTTRRDGFETSSKPSQLSKPQTQLQFTFLFMLKYLVTTET